MILKGAQAERFLDSPAQDIRVAVIYGGDRGGVRERADRLARRLVPDIADPFAVGLIAEGEADDLGRISDELAAQSLLGGARLVRLQTGDKAAADKAVAEALQGHASGAYNPEAFFLVEAGPLSKSSALRKAAENAKAGAVCIAIYEDDAGDLIRLTRESLHKDGVGLTPDAVDLFVGRLPHERGVVRQELERLALFLGPGSGTVGDAALLGAHLGATAEASLFEAAAHAAGGRLGLAYSGLRQAVGEGESGVAAVRALGVHLGRLRRIGALIEEGASPDQAAKSSGVFWKQEREMLRQHRAWTQPALDAIQAEVLAADRGCKTAGSPDVLLAERLYLTVAAQARRLGL